MSLGNLVIGSTTYIDAGNGRYIDSAQQLGGLRNEIKISGGSLAKRANPPVVNASVSRLQEKSVTINGISSTKRGQATVTFSVEPGYTAADIDVLLSDLSTLITASNLNLILNGAS